jgi:hypothetical protein
MEVVKGSAKLYAMVLRGTPDTFAAEACNSERHMFFAVPFAMLVATV